VIYEGNHEPIVSEVLFNKTEELMKKRVEAINGRRFDNGEERLLAGIIYCASCKSHMVGVSTRKNGRKFPYYLCNKRWATRSCDQDYVRADILEAAIIQDIKTMFRDELFIVRVWEEANKQLGAEKPDLEKEITRIDGLMVKTRAKIDRYFEAFENGTMKPDMCSEKVKDRNATLEALSAEKRELEARRKRLELPAIDREMLSRLLDKFEEVLAEGTNPQKKHLLRHMVKKVLIHDRRTVEVWYGLPNQASVRTAGHLAPQMCRSTNRQADPEVWFRFVHLAQNAQSGAPVAAYREQTIEIALGPKGAFVNGNVGALRLRAPPSRVARSIPPSKPAREPKTPRVVELLRKAIEWQALLESSQVVSQAEVARQEGITRARVTQIMGMLRLAPEIQENILTPAGAFQRRPVTERMLRPIGAIANQHDQLRKLHKLLGNNLTQIRDVP